MTGSKDMNYLVAAISIVCKKMGISQAEVVSKRIEMEEKYFAEPLGDVLLQEISKREPPKDQT